MAENFIRVYNIKTTNRILPIKHTCPFLISSIHNYCNLTSVQQLKSVINRWHHFSVVLHQSSNDTTNVKQLPYSIEKLIFFMLIRTDSLTFSMAQVYCTLIGSNTVI